MKFRLLLLMSLAFCCAVDGKLQDHFKYADNKPFNDPKRHAIENIDFIYMINLDERPEKFAASCKELEPYGITPYRFSAVNGWKLRLRDLNELGIEYKKNMPKDLWGTCFLLGGQGKPTHEVMNVVGRNYFSHCLSRGAIGIVLSHLSILQDAYDSGYETIWVMEDDIQVIENPHFLSSLISKLDKTVGKDHWDILFTDPDTKNQQGEYIPCTGFARRPNFTPYNPDRFKTTTIINEHFRKVGARFGAYSMIIRRSGIEKLLAFLKKYKVFLPYDMEFYLPNDMNLYTLRYDVVSTMPQALSDNGAPRYNESK